MVIESNLQKNQLNKYELFEQEEQTFQWTKQWYPVAVVEFLDPARPHAIQLLGKNLVLWRDGQNQWRCFEDFCPHRLAPLSEGRVESDGTLLCAYHAWRFNSEGKCVSIPQSKDKQIEAKHCSNTKSCALSYPTQERIGLIWVWAESGPQAIVESRLRSPRIIPELEENSDKVVRSFWNIRDLPYGWDYFIENVSDPAHVPVSHHGIVGSRYLDAKYYDMLRQKELSTQEGFSFEIVPTPVDIEKAVHDFQPPCLMQIFSINKEGGKLILVLYAVPTRPGWCRHIGTQVFVKDERGRLPKGLGFLALPMPTWLGHTLASVFLHQDSVFLHHQEKIVARRSHERWLDAVYTPNPQDKMIITFRQWFDKRAGGSIPWAEGCNPQLPPAELDKQKLFDVWSTHTQHCRVCQNALKNINRLTTSAYILSAILLLIGLIVDTRYVAVQVALATVNNEASAFTLSFMPPIGFWVATVAAVLLALIGYLLKKFSRLFYVYEFEHFRNN